ARADAPAGQHRRCDRPRAGDRARHAAHVRRGRDPARRGRLRPADRGRERRPGPAMTAAIEARGLLKRYGPVTAVDHVDLTVRAGDVYGYLGPNGAGKTTSLRMLLGLIRPDAGSAKLFGRDPLL